MKSIQESFLTPNYLLELNNIMTRIKITKSRLNLDLPISVREQIDKLLISTEATSLAEVIRTAINLYEFIVAEKELGSKFILHRKNEKEIEIEFLIK